MNVDVGRQVNLALDKFFPDAVGDAIGMQINMAIGSKADIAKSMIDMLLPIKTSQLDKFLGQGFGQPGFCPRPHENYPHNFHMGRPGCYDRESISVIPQNGIAGMFGFKQVNIDGKKIDMTGINTQGMTPQKFEAKLWSDPGFRANIEKQLGGRIVCDANSVGPFADGNITIAKKHPHPMLPFHNQIHQHVGNFLGRCLQPPLWQGVFNQLQNFLKGLGQGPGGPGGAGGGAGGPGAAGGSSPSQQAGGTGQAGGGDPEIPAWDPNQSYEANIAAILNAVCAKFEKKIKDKAEELQKLQSGGKGGAEGAAQGGSGGGGGGFLGSILGGGGGGGGGFLGGITSMLGGGGGGGFIGGITGMLGGLTGGGGGGFIGSILGGGGGGGMLSGIGGLLGGVVGGPIGAMAGQAIGGMAGNILGGAGGGGGAQGAGGGAGGAGGGGAAGESGKSGKSEASIMQEIDALQKTLQRMTETMKNTLQASHDIGMGAARKIAG
jgi:hypothetical protein